MHKTFDNVKNWYFDAFVKAMPEEATTLGLTPAGSMLSVCGEDGPVEELAAHRGVIEALQRLPDPPSGPEVLACEMMRRFAEFRLHLMDERREHLYDLELSLLPVASTLHAAARACDEVNPRAWEGVVERAARIPEVLAARERALAVGVRQGLAAHPNLVQFFADKAIPWAIQSLEAVHAGPRDLREVCGRATAALKRHAAWLLAEVLPANGTASALDPEEHALRRSLAWGLDTPTGEIEAEAEEAVKAAHAAVLKRAKVVGAVGDIGDARALLHQLLAETMQPGDDLAGAYQAAMRRALVISKRERLFAAIDEGSCRVELAHGRPWIGGAVNWPAPLFDLQAKARVLVSPDPSAHSRIAVDNLAIHEGLPGHGLESLAFRQVFGANPSPVELLGVHDDLMQATKWIGPMLRIEGHAVYVEELLLDHDFHSPEGALFAEACKAIRAARVIADLDLHVHGRSLEETAIRFAERSLFPKAWADAQAIRYLRVPLQAAAYHLGGREVRRSVAETQAREQNLDLGQIHEKLFSLGPIPPPIVSSKRSIKSAFDFW